MRFEEEITANISDFLECNQTTGETVWSNGLLITFQTWGIFISVFGGIGNLLTALTIFHQFLLNRKKKKFIYSGNPPTSPQINEEVFFNSSGRFQNERRPSKPPGVFSGTIKTPCCHSIGSWKRESVESFSLQEASNDVFSVLKVEGDTLLIFHLTLCDFIYCVVSLPHTCYVIGFDYNGDSPPLLCQEAAFFRYVNAYAEWMTLGLLIVQRCVDLTKLPKARFFRLKSTIGFIVGIWVFSFLLQMGYYITESFGYSHMTRKCDFIGSKDGMLHFYTIDSLIPCTLMSCGCLSIIIQVIKNKRRLQRLDIHSEVLLQREKEMFQSTLLILCLLLLFLICVLPICVYNVLYALGMTQNVLAGVLIFMLYWIQYGINFIVYVAINNKYRRAYRLFFTDFKNTVCSFISHIVPRPL